MATMPWPSETVPNWALAALPRREFHKLAPGLEPVNLEHHQVLSEPGQHIPHVHFPCGGLVSLLVPLGGGKVAEVAVVGREGVVGLPVFLGGAASPYQVMVQAPGPALRMRADEFQALVRRRRPLADLLLRYTNALMVQMGQSAVCNCLHPVPKRYCRWLLMAHDRVESDCLPFSQKFLAMMLTVRLASISEAASALRRAGLIHYNRGDVTILDRAGLERACCTCYRSIKYHFDCLPGPPALRGGRGG